MKHAVDQTVQVLRTDLAAFFDTFAQAFRSFDGNTIAQRYAAPYLALDTGGALKLLQTPADIAGYFQDVLDNYFAQGCRSCRYIELEVFAVGSQSATGSVTWELLGQDGKVITHWRESYNFMRTEHGWRIFSSTDHAG
jgi:hypothetical protein